MPSIRSFFGRFTEKMPVILTGGGVNYYPVREALEEMFLNMRYTVHIADKEKSLISAAAGYRIAARQQFGGTGIGIDVGNHNVVVMGNK
jgi:TPP-dependent trihydroxycyclohexane-1,2-dione (THcHDO) dehydratase